MIEIKSFNQILGNMVRKIVAETPVSDINPGSVFLSLLEACASNDFENNVAILNILELLNVDSTRNSDLDKKASDLGLTRRTPVAASGAVTIYNSKITKQSTSLYSLKPAPIIGQTSLFVTNAIGWASSGVIYIGRGTNSFEGPISYTSVEAFGPYYKLTLSSALQKDHLHSDVVINGQGQSDLRIPAGTVVKIPANNQTAAVSYSTLREAVIPAGEDRVEGVVVVASTPGTRGNALINTIRQFETSPFAGATVANHQAFTTGSDIETDAQLRTRIKSFAASLARGTAPAILRAVLGVSDPDENKRVVSAVMTKPVTAGEPSILYVDDGSCFQPSYAGQAVDTLIANATGNEEFVQLSHYPLPRPQVSSYSSGPFSMVENMFLNVAVDGVEESISFTSSDFQNISVATMAEVVSAINDKATLFNARLDGDSSRILLTTTSSSAETLQVMPLRSIEDEDLYANSLLGFPTNEVSYIVLYKNNTRLRQQAKSAAVQTVPFAAWNLLTDGNLIISVDGTPSQNVTFTIADFPGFTSFSLLSLENWVDALNAKFAGITASATANQTMQIASNKSGDLASVSIIGGSYLPQMFATNITYSEGQTSDFEINRQTGNVRITTDIAKGDVISAGTSDTKGFVLSADSNAGTFNVDVDSSGRKSQMVIVVDSNSCERLALNVQVGTALAVTDRGSSVMRIMADSVSVFENVRPGAYIYIADRLGWFSADNTGIFRVISRGSHIQAGVDSWIEVRNNAIVVETKVVADADDIAAFATDGYPQIWSGSYVDSPSSISIVDLASSLNSSIGGIKASIFRTVAVRLTSTTEANGSIAVPVSIGRISSIFPATAQAECNNDSLVAAKSSRGDMLGFPKIGQITSGNTYLSRTAYPIASSSLMANSQSDVYPYASAHSEELQASALTSADASDTVIFTHGDNRGIRRAIAAKVATDTVRTQHALARPIFDHVASNDEITVFESLQFTADDSIVCVMDGDAQMKTVDVSLARTGKVNVGSGSGSFLPTATEFSATDMDNEDGVDFSTASVWGTNINATDFSDYAILMRARNWYASGGTAGTGGKLVIRAKEYGLNGEKMRFCIEYPATHSQLCRTTMTESPSSNLLTYYFGSGSLRDVNIAVGITVSLGSDAPTGYRDLTFPDADFSAVQVGDVLSTPPGCGLPSGLIGQFRISAKTLPNTIRIYAPTAPAGTNYVLLNLVQIFPLTSTEASEIATEINRSNVLSAAVIGASAPIVLATRDENYSYTSDATALAHDHNPLGANAGSIGLYDGINFVKTFQNANPNFTTKSALTLVNSGVSTSIYSFATAPNAAAEELTGEYFKLVPTSIVNVEHHLKHKALSQLPILSNISNSDGGNNIQVTSKRLGSAGRVQMYGGQANSVRSNLIGDTVTASDSAGSYALVSVPAYPSAYSVGDIVKMQNRAGVKRLSRLGSTDSISVYAEGNGYVKYLWNPRDTNFTSATTIAITDVSSEYGSADGMVFRWTHSTAGGENLANVSVGDLVAAYGTGWAQNNLAKTPGDGKTAGLPIVQVDNAGHSFDVVCPRGAVMTATAIGTGAVDIFPTARVKWNVAHAAVGGLLEPTRYRLERLGPGDLVRLAAVGGEQPRFLDAGVAVDDYIVIAGTTFNSLNNGIFRVLAVANDYIVFENSNAVDNTTQLNNFNDAGDLVFWTANGMTVSGSAGCFQNLSTGLWVKKVEDSDICYAQVVGCDTGDYATATKITLGRAYSGITGNAPGISYDQSSSFEQGIALRDTEDVSFYDGDAAMVNDSLFVQDITHTDWFSGGNIGSFPVVSLGSDETDYRPYVRVKNALGTTESNRQMAVSPGGLYLVESDANKFYSYRRVYNSIVKSNNGLSRSLYLLPDSRAYKFSEANGTFISQTGKLNFDVGPAVGTDGYSYYTGLYRRVQRTVDGYSPDPTNFPEMRALGSSIEIMPPLIAYISLVLTITTNQGSTVQDIADNVKSTIIDYVNGLGVGQDVILSAIIAEVMKVRGVAAVTFNVPSADQERISIAPNEKAVITAGSIGIN